MKEEKETQTEIPKKYVPETEEMNIIKFWNEKNVFSFKEKSTKKLFSIDTPPPYASAGHLHIGHAMSYSHTEFIARYKRMAGFNVFYPMGFDDNGLPTEKYVEKKHNVNKKNISRTEFVKLCLKETEEVRKKYKELWQRIGLSVDWDQTYSTINPHCQKISQMSFIDLYKKNLIKHIDAPTTWCPHCMTAVAQADFENVDIKSEFNDIIFKTKNEDLIISTTRPELLPACVALFANPEDERYKKLKGKTATVPLFEYEVPILFDEAVSIEKGTGLMMVCTFGDKEDVEKWGKYNLPLKICITEDGHLNEEAETYKGLKIKEARKKIIEDLKEKKLLLSQKEITHAVNTHERCNTEIEFVKKKQWYISVVNQKEELIKFADKINWYPEFMKIRYEHWVKNLNWDWNISRQRFYGVSFPVWYSKKTGEIILPEIEDLPIDPTRDKPKKMLENHKAEDIIPETDVMDTWATSSMTPQINYHWRLKTEKKEMIPMDLRPQGHDIIRTWAFYTITKAYYHDKNIPWKDIVISGHGQDSQGKKMSKSKGNVVWIEDVIKKYSSDALRYWSAGSGLGDDCPYQEKDVLTGQKLVNKIFNAGKFVMLLLEKEFDPEKKPELTHFDKWILSELDKLIIKCTNYFEKYQFEKVKQEVDNFFWNIFCDNYLEIVKDRLYKPESYEQISKDSAQYTLYTTYKQLIKMIHPIMPFITETMWQNSLKKYEKQESIAISEWPKPLNIKINKDEEIAGKLTIDICTEIRRFKSKNNKSLNANINIKINCDETTKKQTELILQDIISASKAQKIEFTKEKIRTDIELFESIGKKSIEANEEKIPEKAEFLTLQIDFL